MSLITIPNKVIAYSYHGFIFIKGTHTTEKYLSQNASLSESILTTENALYFCLLYLGFKPGLFNARFYT